MELIHAMWSAIGNCYILQKFHKLSAGANDGILAQIVVQFLSEHQITAFDLAVARWFLGDRTNSGSPKSLLASSKSFMNSAPPST